jgi:large subunit ribosomal protein L22
MPVIATAKDIQISPRKVTVVAALVRGHSVEDALTILKFTPRQLRALKQMLTITITTNPIHYVSLRLA